MAFEHDADRGVLAVAGAPAIAERVVTLDCMGAEDPASPTVAPCGAALIPAGIMLTWPTLG